ncbi:DNA-protecting protein DprA [Patescibacteria group bacterium]|nr:DNA-protecting protein DprA [Patescibacteria group bacterium]
MDQKIQIITVHDKAYPPLLHEIPHPPTPLYYRGALNALNDIPAVAIVGTRRATRYGLETGRALARDLSLAGVLVVSGLALGIDAQAHRGALEGKTPTWAVLGSGLNQIYPAHNRLIAKKILEEGGAVISEFPSDHPPEKWTFPQRNRIIAGLCKATIVVEAPEKSGALITARLALEYNRDVGAVPGEISSIHSVGTNRLLKMGAAMIRSAEDVLELIGMEISNASGPDALDKNEEDLLRILEKPMDANMLAQKSGFEIRELNQKLTMLELSGKIKKVGGTFHKV